MRSTSRIYPCIQAPNLHTEYGEIAHAVVDLGNQSTRQGRICPNGWHPTQRIDANRDEKSFNRQWRYVSQYISNSCERRWLIGHEVGYVHADDEHGKRVQTTQEVVKAQICTSVSQDWYIWRAWSTDMICLLDYPSRFEEIEGSEMRQNDTL